MIRRKESSISNEAYWSGASPGVGTREHLLISSPLLGLLQRDRGCCRQTGAAAER